MKIKAMTQFKHGQYHMQQYDTLTVPDEDGLEMVGYGYAMNTETGKVGKLNQDPAELNINSSKLGLSNTEI